MTFLPEPVVPYEFYESFIDPFRNVTDPPTFLTDLDSKDAEFVGIYRGVVHAIPGMHRQLLLYLLDMLAVFASKSDLNKMTTAKLAVIFQHGLLRSRDTAITTKQLLLTQDVLIFLIEQNDYLLFETEPQATSNQPTS